jgi:hypothetical protein
MPEPAKSQRQRIIEALQDALQAIDGVSGLYHYPVAHESQVSIDPTDNVLTVNGADLPFYVIEPTPDGSREFFPAMQLKDEFELNVHARKDCEDGDPVGRVTTWENLVADMEVALTQDVTLGGLVYDVRLGTPRPFVGVGSNIVIVVQPVTVRLHRTYGEPA